MTASCQMRRLVLAINDGTHGTFERVSDGVPLLSAKNISEGQVLVGDAESRISTTDYLAIHRTGYLRKGDVLLTIVGSIGRSALFDLDYPVAFQRSVASIRPGPAVDGRYLRYVFESADFQRQLGACTRQSAQGGIYLGDLAEMQIPRTEIKEQRSIANYLDAETTRIGTLIEKKRRMIDLLEARAKMLSYEVVVHGIRIPAHTVNVAGGWFSTIPIHWNVMPLKMVTSFINGTAFKANEWNTSGLPIIRIENLNGSDDFNHADQVVEPRLRVGKGDLLFGWSGNRGTSFGPFRWSLEGEFALNQHIFRLPAPNVDRSWLYWALRAATLYVEELAHGIIGMVHITKDKLGGILLPIPPADEQREIAERLDELDGANRRLSQVLNRQIDLLAEHRQALITAAVTGELEIPGVAA